MTNRCLCCQGVLETGMRYHPRCLKALWGKPLIPTIPFGVTQMPGEVIKVEGRMSISGVQMKAVIRLKGKTSEVEVVASGGTHILKPDPNQYEGLPQNENACMNMAAACGLPVPPHGLFPMADGRLCYIIKRFDRTEDGTKVQKETMFQILGAADKYAGSLESVGRAIRAHAENVGLDTIDFFERVLFCFLTGNGDMHLKNWALVTRGRTVALAPCYDLVSSRLYLPNEEDSALSINGRKNKLARSDFETFAEHLRIDPKAAANIFEKFRNARGPLEDLCAHSELAPSLQERFSGVISSRHARVFGGELQECSPRDASRRALSR